MRDLGSAYSVPGGGGSGMSDSLACRTCESEGVCLPDCPAMRYRFARILGLAHETLRLRTALGKVPQPQLARIMAAAEAEDESVRCWKSSR